MTKSFPSHQLDKVALRLPEGMREKLQGAAEAENRSMNAEIVSRLEQTFSPSPMPEALRDQIERLTQIVDRLTEQLAAANPKFAATRAYFSDPKTAEEIYTQHNARGQPAPVKATKKPRSRKR